jgi:hypothetical protein
MICLIVLPEDVTYAKDDWTVFVLELSLNDDEFQVLKQGLMTMEGEILHAIKREGARAGTKLHNAVPIRNAVIVAM